MEAKSLGRLLKNQGILNESDWTTIEKACGSKPTEIIKGITSIGLISETDLSNILAEKSGAKLAKGALIADFDRDVLEFVDPVLMQRLEVVPLKEIDADRIAVALANPLDKALLRQLEFFTGRKIVPIVATPTQISECLEELIEGYEPKPSPFKSFIKQFAPPMPASDRPGASISPEDLDEFYEDVELSEEEKEIIVETDDLDIASLNSLEGDEDEISFADPHKHSHAEDEETLDFNFEGASETTTVEDGETLDLNLSPSVESSSMGSESEDDISGEDLLALMGEDGSDNSALQPEGDAQNEISDDLSLNGIAEANNEESEPDSDDSTLVENELLDMLPSEGQEKDMAELDEMTASADVADVPPAESDANEAEESVPMDQGDIDSLFAIPVETDIELETTEAPNADPVEDEVDSSEPFDQNDIDSLFANMGDSAEVEEGLDDTELQSAESSLEPTDEDEAVLEEVLTQELPPETKAQVENSTLVRSGVSAKEKHHNIANIGVLNRALMDLQFSSEAEQAVDICKDALSLVFENGIIYLPDLDAQVLVHWQNPAGEVSAEVSEYLGSIAKDLAPGWNSNLHLETDKLPWSSKSELFIYKTNTEKLGQVVWISETENAEKVTTGIATTCRQILLQFVGLWDDLQK